MELFKLLGTIAINNDGAKAAISETTEIASGAQSKISGAFGKIGSAAVKVGKVAAAGLAVGATAITALAKTALDGYADFEQLKGGVETLFGAGGKSLEEYAASVGKTTNEVREEYYALMNAQNMVLANANEAYKNAGMSANEYMETVTSFSASLIQSLNGDTEAAAEKANQAIIDMSDNANKMGSSMESIQNAYQGFAKQNYTMLDNLKLGYGGTKTEMERLLADAQAISGIEYDISSYADVVDAIHVIQEEMGIAGTTAAEAAGTISGSVSAMKSAWSNLVAGLGNDNANMTVLIDNFVDSAVTAFDNILPRIEKILGGIADVVKKIVPVIADKLPALIETLLPPLLEGAVALFNGIVAALPTLLQILIEQMPFIIVSIGSALLGALPQLLAVIKEILGQIWDFISLELLNTGVSFDDAFSGISTAFSNLWTVVQGIWSSIGQPIWDAIVTAIQYVAANWGSISGSISTLFQTLWSVCKTVWDTIGKPIWDMISFAIASVAGLFGESMPAITGFFQTAIDGIKDSWENHLKPIFDAIGNVLNNVVKPAFEFVWKTIVEPLIKNVFGYIANLWNNTLKPVFDGICDFLLGSFTNDWETAFNGILSIFEGVFNMLQSTAEAVIGTIVDVISNAIAKIKEFFGLASDAEDVKLPTVSTGDSGGSSKSGGGGASKNGSSTGVEYYASGGVMTNPTVFGYNPYTNNSMVGGEAGAEAIAPISTLQAYIADAVTAKDEQFLLSLESIIEYQTSTLVNAIMNLQESGTIKLEDPNKLFKLYRNQKNRFSLATGGEI